MPAIKKEQVLDDSVKRAFDDLNASIKLSVDTLVDMTKKAKLINEQMGSGSNISQMSKATADYNANLKDQAISEQEVIKLERQKIALEKDKLALESAKKKAADSELKAAKLKEDALKREAKANETAAQKAEQARQREVLAAQKAADAITKEDNKRAASAKKASDAIVEAARKAEADIAKSDAKTASLKAKSDSQAIKDAERKAKADEKEAKAAKKKAEQTAKETTEYYKLSKAYRDADKAAKEAGATFGRNSVQFKKAKEEAKKLGDQLNGLNRDLGHNQDNVGNYSSAFESLGEGLLGGFGITLGLTAVIGGIKSVVQNSMAFEKALSSLKAITGVSTAEMEFFRTKAIQMSKDSVLGATEIVKAFELVGSKSPELLKSKDALASVTEQAIILSEATGGQLGLEESVGAVTAAMNTFGISAMEAGRIANVFAAGSKEGSAEVASLTESFKNAGTVAKDANMTLEETVSMLEVLGEKSIYGAEAGTKLRGSILKLQAAGKGYASGKFNIKDALIEVNAELEKQGTQLEKDALKAKLFGAENITVGSIMLQNVGKFEQMTTAITGTTTALEQQKEQNDNLSTSMSKLGNAWDSWMLSLSDSNGMLKKTVDYLSDVINRLAEFTMDEPAKQAAMAGKAFSELNKGLSALTVDDQVTELEKEFSKMSEILAQNQKDFEDYQGSFEQGFDEGLLGGVWNKYTEFVNSFTGLGQLSEADVLGSNKAYAKMVQQRLEMLYAEQAKKKEVTETTRTETDATNKKITATGKEITASRDLIKIQQELLRIEQDKDAVDEDALITKKFKIQAIENEIKRLQELGSIKEITPVDTSSIVSDQQKMYDEMEAMEQEYLDGFIKSENEKTRVLEEEAQNRADIQMQWVDTVSSGVEEMESAMWDNIATGREDAMNAEIEAMQERLDNENLDEEQRAEIQKQIDEKEKQLKIKNAKAEKNEALMKIGIDTLMAVAKIKATMAILAANPLTWPARPVAAMQIPFVIASGAMSAAAVSMRKIPEYAEGTDFHQGGYAVVGDGGKHELVETPSGAKYLTPNTDTLINLERGSKVVSGDDVNERLAELTRSEIVNMALPSSIDKYQHTLINKLISEQMKTTKAVNSISIPQPMNIEKAIRFETFKQRLKN